MKEEKEQEKWVWMDIWLAQTDSYEAAALGGGGGGWVCKYVCLWMMGTGKGGTKRVWKDRPVGYNDTAKAVNNELILLFVTL